MVAGSVVGGDDNEMLRQASEHCSAVWLTRAEPLGTAASGGEFVLPVRSVPPYDTFNGQLALPDSTVGLGPATVPGSSCA